MMMKRTSALFTAMLIAAPSFAATSASAASLQDLDTETSAVWWQAQDASWSPLAEGIDGRGLADAWQDASTMEAFLGAGNGSGWFHGSEHPEIFPYWMAISELASVLDREGNDGKLFSRLEDNGLSADGALTVVKGLLGSRLDAVERDAEILENLSLANKAMVGSIHPAAMRSADVEASREATRQLKDALSAQDWAAFGDYLFKNVVPAMSVLMTDEGRVFVTWLPNFEARATYRGAASPQADAVSLLTDACRQGLEQAHMPFDEKATQAAKAGLLRDGYSLICRVGTVEKLVGDASKVMSHTIPSSMACGTSVPVSITMGNSGSTTWAYHSCYRLGSYGGYDPFFDRNVRHNLPVNTVAPRETVTFDFTLDAPTTPGNYVTDWQMIAAPHCGGGGWFGAVASQTVSVSCGPNAAVDNHTLPTSMYCGQVKTAQVTMENTGTTTWTAADGYSLTYVDGTDPLIWYGSLALPTSAAIAPGQTHTFDLTYRADNAMSGTYVTDFEMRDWPVTFGEQAASTVNVTCNTTPQYERVYGSSSVPLAPGSTLQATVFDGGDQDIHIHIEALGTDPLTISNYTTAWSGDPEIEILDGVPGHLNPGQSSDIIFSIDETLPLGTYTGQLTLDINSSTQPVVFYIQFHIEPF